MERRCGRKKNIQQHQAGNTGQLLPVQFRRCHHAVLDDVNIAGSGLCELAFLIVEYGLVMALGVPERIAMAKSASEVCVLWLA